MAEIELDIWEGDWGLPSVDHQCLAVMTYCKFAEVPVKMCKVNNPWKSPSGELPVLRQDNQSYYKVQNIFNHLRENNLSADFELSSKQSADILAFTALLEEKLLPALLHLWWSDSKMYVDVTRPWFGHRLPFPLGMFLPNQIRKQVMKRLYHSVGADHMTDSEREAKILKGAKECLNQLAKKLGENTFFLGKMPSSLDAVVFGYLAPLLNVPFSNTQLQHHIKACPNLDAFCKRILDKYFPLDPKEIEELKKRAEEEEEKRRENAMDFPNRRRNMLIGGAVALSAMVAYAFLSGLVQIEVTDAEDENEADIPEPRPISQYGDYFEGNEQETGDDEE